MDITVDDLLLQMEASLGSLAAAINRDLDPAERISTMVIATGPWTVGNGLITPTLKIRRSSFGRRFPMRAARHSRRPQAARSMRPARALKNARQRAGARSARSPSARHADGQLPDHLSRERRPTHFEEGPGSRAGPCRVAARVATARAASGVG
jgi:hypothetical protein